MQPVSLCAQRNHHPFRVRWADLSVPFPVLLDEVRIILPLQAPQALQHNDKADDTNAGARELSPGGDAPGGRDETRINGVPVPKHLPPGTSTC